MRDTWLKLASSILRPARSHLDQHLLIQRERYLEERQNVAQERARALAECEQRIEAARARVFAAKDGVVTAQMTELEREWRRLSRRNTSDGALMDLWARIAPRSWIDRKRWRDSAPEMQADAAIALAGDVEGVEAAEAALDRLRAALAASSGIALGRRTRFRLLARDFLGMEDLLAPSLKNAREGLAPRAIDRARHLQRDVHDAMLARFPEREPLVHAVAHAALVDAIWRASALGRSAPNPITPLCDLWATGYVLSEVDAEHVTLEIPPLASCSFAGVRHA